MKNIIVIVFLFATSIYSQANLIQSIDFDSQQRVVYGLTGLYDYSYAMRYKDGNIESWNLTQMFNLPFEWISTAVDNNDNIWAFMQDKIYKYDGNLWSVIDIPSHPTSYQKISDLSYYNGYLWLSTYYGGVYNNLGVWRYSLADSSWTIFSPANSIFPSYSQHGSFFHNGDSTWIGTNKGLVLITNDSVSFILDTTNTHLTSEFIYSFFIDSNHNSWIGTMNEGLLKWVNDTTFISFNSSNSNLPNNFINAIDEDSKGRLWLATDSGFAYLKDDSIVSFSYLNNRSIVTLVVDNNDNIWIGESGRGILLLYKADSLFFITDIHHEAIGLKEYKLLQNFPNPFNPSTTISYQLPTAGNVTLKVYDVLGNEVATLVDEYKPAGSHEVEFQSASSGSVGSFQLTSGIYFYQLKAGDFVETKKMILIK